MSDREYQHSEGQHIPLEHYTFVTVQEAAEALELSTEAVRQRAKRGTLRSERRDGKLLVAIETYQHESHRYQQTYDHQSDERTNSGTDGLVDQLRSEISFLREQVEEEREARRRADHIIAQLGQANASLGDRLAELEASPKQSEASESSQPGEEAPKESAEPEQQSEVEEQLQSGENRSWWRRLFGG